MTPPPVIGLRRDNAPCASKCPAANSSKRTAIIECATFLLPSTTFSFLILLLRSSIAIWRSNWNWLRFRTTLLIYRHPSLNQQVHSAIDRDARHARFFIDPAITIQLVFLVHEEITKLAALIRFQHGSAIVFEILIHIRLGHYPGYGSLGANQRTGGHHLGTFVLIEKGVH